MTALPVRIAACPELALTPAVEADIAGLLASCFDTDFGGRSYFQQRHHLRLLVWKEDRLIGHAALLLRAVRLGAALMDVAGLAEVATHPDHRGQGIAAALVARAIAEAAASPACHLLLFGTARVYAAAGFVPHSNPMTWVDMAGARMGAVMSARAETLMVRPLTDLQWNGTAPLDLLGNLF